MLGNEPQLKLITKVLFLLCFTFFFQVVSFNRGDGVITTLAFTFQSSSLATRQHDSQNSQCPFVRDRFDSYFLLAQSF